jgi:hypothetical protein
MEYDEDDDDAFNLMELNLSELTLTSFNSIQFNLI